MGRIAPLSGRRLTRRGFLAGSGRAAAGLAGLSLAGPLASAARAAAKTRLTVWWWGEQEASGLQAWMQETAAQFEAAHPGVEVATVLQATESLYPSFTAAGEARQGPDVQYMWGGLSTMQFAWRGYVHPVSDLLGQEELGHIFPDSLRETAFQGKVYGLPWYTTPFLLAYSKPAFAKAGLDPDHPPHAWDEFLAAAGRLRAAGFAPWGYGVKGLTGIGNFNSLFILQDLDAPTDLLKTLTGEVPFTDARYSGWLGRVEEMIRKGVFNRDVSSLEYFQAQDLLLSGEAAMVLIGQAKVNDLVKTLGEADVGVMLPPRFGSGRLAGRMSNTTQQLLVTSWSAHPAEAAGLMRFFHQPERLERMHVLSGTIPPDDRFDRRKLRHAQDRTILGWMAEQSTTNYQNFWPPQMDRENLFLAIQSLFSGALSADRAARQVEAFLSRWRDANPEAVKTLAAWASGVG